MTNIEKFRLISREILEQYIDKNLSRKELAKEFGVSRRTIDRRFKELDLHTKGHDFRKNLHFNIHKFDIIDTEEKAYWAGMLFSDGYIGDSGVVRLKLSKQDYEHLVKFKNFMEDDRTDEDRIKLEIAKKDGKEYPQYYYYIYSRYLANALIKLGCTPRKSLTLKFPDESLFTDKNLIYDFIRGYVDGDGCIYNERGKISIDMAGTYEFLSKVKEYLPLFPSIMKQGNIYRIRSRGENGDQIAYKLYEHATIYLDRKYLRYATLCRLHNSETSDKIGESCDANAEVTPEIAKGSESTVENSE
jgi:hypothetical protein